ncbi:hypothetical protein C8R46DRAFT_1220640 [Mycena filopes]|nr:hypothetical protein C8R46DRAFT_1220640 [Mycena filopes]
MREHDLPVRRALLCAKGRGERHGDEEAEKSSSSSVSSNARCDDEIVSPPQLPSSIVRKPPSSPYPTSSRLPRAPPCPPPAAASQASILPVPRIAPAIFLLPLPYPSPIPPLIFPVLRLVPGPRRFTSPPSPRLAPLTTCPRPADSGCREGAGEGGYTEGVLEDYAPVGCALFWDCVWHVPGVRPRLRSRGGTSRLLACVCVRVGTDTREESAPEMRDAISSGRARERWVISVSVTRARMFGCGALNVCCRHPCTAALSVSASCLDGGRVARVVLVGCARVHPVRSKEGARKSDLSGPLVACCLRHQTNHSTQAQTARDERDSFREEPAKTTDPRAVVEWAIGGLLPSPPNKSFDPGADREG